MHRDAEPSLAFSSSIAWTSSPKRLRERDVRSRFGGSDFIDLGAAPLVGTISPPKPDFAFSPQTVDMVEQFTGGFSYSIKWEDLFEIRAGLQRTNYEKTVDNPNFVPTSLTSNKWLPNFTASVELTPELLAYGSYTRGLEENGQAPDFADNRLEILPALITRQIDGGLRWAPTKNTTILIGYFDIQKPYFNLDNANIFQELGDVTHSGVEMSIATHPVEGLRIVAGAVIQDPRVNAGDTVAQDVGGRPVGQARTTFQLNADYRLPFIKGVSFDLSVSKTGKEAANVQNDVFTRSFTTIGLGSRYQFKIGDAPATFRASVSNLTNKFVWLTLGSNAFEPLNQRSFNAYLTIDF